MRKNQGSIILSLWVTFLISMTGTVGLEEFDNGEASSQISMRSLSQQSYPALAIPFDCFNSSKIITSRFLMQQQSLLVRTTILKICEFIQSDQNITIFQFNEIKSFINRSRLISEKWNYIGFPFFIKMNDIVLTSSLQKLNNTRYRFKLYVPEFVDSLDSDDGIDSLELKLLLKPIVSKTIPDDVIALTRALVGQKREEIAIHYLFSFGHQAKLWEEAGLFYKEAKKLGSTEASSIVTSMKRGQNISQSWRIKHPSDLVACEYALLYMLQGDIKEDLAYKLTKILGDSKLKGIARSYLLALGEAKESVSDLSAAKRFYSAAKKLGSKEAKKKLSALEQSHSLVDEIMNFRPEYVEFLRNEEIVPYNGSD